MKNKQNIYERLRQNITKQDHIFTDIFTSSVFLYMPMLFLYDYFIHKFKDITLLRPLYESYQYDINAFAIFLPPAMPIIFTGGLFYIIIKGSRSQVEKLVTINSNILKEIQKAAENHSIEEILTKNLILQKHVRDLSRMTRYFFWLKSDVKKLLMDHINEILTDILNTLELLQRQLLGQIQREKNILEKQQIKIRENITGSDYLNQISELQSNRLARQIKQFEELQRILH